MSKYFSMKLVIARKFSFEKLLAKYFCKVVVSLQRRNIEL